MRQTNSGTPLVSVIMPAYNAERFVEEAIRSVMDQTVEDWELLVLDDCSRDGTCAIVERLAREDARIVLIRNEQNQGVAKTRNRGMDLSRGQYIALLDSDDVWYPEKLEKQLALARKTEADIVYCSYGIMDENGLKRCDDFIVPERTDFDEALIKSVISCSTVLLSRKIVDSYRFDTVYYHEDLALWIRLMHDGFQACGVTAVLASYRVMAGTRAGNKIKVAVYRWEIYRGMLRFSVFRSAVLLLRYGLLGLKKYKKAK